MFIPLLLCIPIFLPAQPLAELRAELLANNPELQALEYRYQSGLERTVQVGVLPDTEISVGGFPLPVETRLGPQQLRLSAMQMIPWPGLLNQEKEVARAAAYPAYERLQARTLELIYELEIAYWQTVEIRGRERILSKQLDVLESQEALALARIGSGQASSVEVLKIQLQKQEIREELALLEVGMIDPESRIRALLAWPVDRLLSMSEEPGFPVMPMTFDSLLAMTERVHPSLRYWGAQQEVSQERIALNRLQAKPDFGVGVDYIMVGERENAVISNNGRDVVQLRATVRIPIQQRQFDAREREERLLQQVYIAEEKTTWQSLRAELERAYANYERAEVRWQSKLEQQATMEAMLRLLNEELAVGGNRLPEILSVEQQLLDFQLEQLSAKMDAQRAVAIIRKMIVL